MSDYNNLTANLQVATLNTANIGVGRYILNDYVIEIIEAEDGNGYTMNIRKGSQVQTMHLTELTPEYVNKLINDGLREAKASGEFDGFSPIATVEDSVIGAKITITDKNGTTTEYVRDGKDGKDGVDGFSPTVRAMETADGIAVTATQKDGTFDIVHVNDGYSPTANVAKNGDTQVITITDKNGTTTTDILDGVGISSAVLDESTYQLTLYFTNGTSYTTQPIRGQKGDTGNGISSVTLNDDYTITVEYTDGTSWTSDEPLIGANADWEAAEGEPGYILNKVPLVKGSGEGSVQGALAEANGMHSLANGGATAIGVFSHAEGIRGNVNVYIDGEANNNVYTLSRASTLYVNEFLKKKQGSFYYNGINSKVIDFDAGTGKITLEKTLSNTAFTDQKVSYSCRSLASGKGAHSEGISIASGQTAHSEGNFSVASGPVSHAEGNSTHASSSYSHAEGGGTVASGIVAHAEGSNTIASGVGSHAEGAGTVANHKSQHVSGEFNVEDPSTAGATARGNYVEIVGNGTYTDRSNARTLDWSGNQWLAGILKVGGISYDDPNAKEVATKEYVNNIVPDTLITYVHLTGTYDSNAGKTIYTADMTATEIQSALSNGPVVVLYNGKEYYINIFTAETGFWNFVRIDPYDLENTNIITIITLLKQSNTWGIRTYEQKVPDENIKIISGTWTTPTSGNPYMDYDDPLINDGALINLINDGQLIILKVHLPNDPDEDDVTNTKYFYLNGNISGGEEGHTEEAFAFWSMPSSFKNINKNYASVLMLLHAHISSDDLYGWEYGDMAFPVNDVRVNGTSVVGQNGVADITIATPNWKAAEGEDGYIANRPILWGGSKNGLTNITSSVDTSSGQKAVSFGSSASFSIYITGDPGATTYSYTGSISETRERLIRNCVTKCTLNNVSTTIIDVDRTQQTITFESTLSTESAIVNKKLSVFLYPSASGSASFSVGLANASKGDQSFTNGMQNVASGQSSSASGISTIASGLGSNTMGNGTIANHAYQNVFGKYNIEDSSTEAATAQGNYVEIVGNGDINAHSNARTLDWNGNEWIKGNFKMGGNSYDDPNAIEVATKNDIVTPDWEAVEGEDGYILNKIPLIKGSGTNSVQGLDAVASGNGSFAIGRALASGSTSYAEGASGATSINLTGEANSTTYALSKPLIDTFYRDAITNKYAWVVYNNNICNVIGINNEYTEITFDKTLSETTTFNNTKISLNVGSIASNSASHAEGISHSLGIIAHSEGAMTTASSMGSHSEGSSTTASGNASHAEGSSTTASGMSSHAEGSITVASGSFSHADGFRAIANHRAQHVFGECNIEDPSTEAATVRGNYVEIVGNGTGSIARSNARTLDWSGNEWVAGKFKMGGTSYDDVNAKEVETAVLASAPLSEPAPIVTIENGEEGMPVKELTFDIEPVQDLHGYDNPWPAGGGKNLFDNDNALILTNRYFKNVGDDGQELSVSSDSACYALPCLPNTTYTVKANNESYNSLSRVAYVNVDVTILTDSDTPTLYNFMRYSPNTAMTITTGADATYLIMQFVKSNVLSRNLLVQVELGSTATSYAPYSNICPITGYTGAEIVRTGKSFYEPLDYAQYVNGTAQQYWGTNVDVVRNAINKLPKGRQYSIIFDFKVNSVNASATDIEYGMQLAGTGYSGGRSRIAYPDRTVGQVIHTKCSFFLNENANITQAYFYASRDSATLQNFMIIEGNTDSTYEPYTGTTIPITFPTEAGTVYGGRIEIKDGEAKLVMTHGQIASYNSETLPGEWISDRDVYAEGTTPVIGSQVVYELATPITYTIDPVTLTTIQGLNHIWANTGDISSLTYITNPGIYELIAGTVKSKEDVKDVQINGTSIVNDGVANVPIGGNSTLGVVKGSDSIGMLSNGAIGVIPASVAQLKALQDNKQAITSGRLHNGVFYGLAKAAGDTTQASSDNAVGTYTDNAKASIKAMLGVTDGIDPETITVTGTDPVITGVPNARYICGEVYSLSITPPSGGIIDVIFTSGTTVTVLTLPNTVRLPEWWEGPEAGYTYEICITDGTYAVITSWPVA